MWLTDSAHPPTTYSVHSLVDVAATVLVVQVHQLAACTLSSAGLPATLPAHSGYLSSHLRRSPEKVAEVERSHKRLPDVGEYANLTLAASAASGLRSLFVQSASSSLLSELPAAQTDPRTLH